MSPNWRLIATSIVAAAMAGPLPGEMGADPIFSPEARELSKTLQSAGVIRGRVEVRKPLAQSERRPGIGDLGMSLAREATDRTRAVVYLESAPAGAFDDPGPLRATMDQRNETFVPHVLAISVGTTVDFPNSDQTYHNVFSLEKTRRFDLGRYAAGRSKSIRFDRSGIVRVFCEIHSHMSAFILVFGHRYFDITGADGRYQIAGVPPGRYTVVAWNEGGARESRVVVVPDDGGSVEADFMLQ
jgi:plastocyanin